MRIRWLVVGWALGSAVRRLSQQTGVTDAEAQGTLPGDEVIPHLMVEWTRGVTVHAAEPAYWSSRTNPSWSCWWPAAGL